jgi:hypothetical protein
LMWLAFMAYHKVWLNLFLVIHRGFSNTDDGSSLENR